ncbi:MAG: MurR/RpiR family transcriptional regulator [Culicoidibacterales bacterium]
MQTIEKLIHGIKLSATERQVFQYIIDNHQEMLQLGVRGIAQKNYTSTSTVMRLTKKLGYTGFIDMHYKVSSLLEDTKHKLTQAEFNTAFLPSFFEKDQQEHKIRRVAQEIYQESSQYFFIYATGFSGIIGEYIYKKLLVLGKKALFATGSDSVGVLDNNLENISVFLTVSKSGETKQVISKAITAKESGLFVVSFTSSSTNTLAKSADINFVLADLYPFDDRNMLPNPFFSNVIMMFEKIIYAYHAEIVK